MTVYARLILACWLIWFVYWVGMAVGAKKSTGARFGWRESGPRVGIIVLLLFALRLPALRHAVRTAQVLAGGAGVVTGPVGLALCGLGIGLALWARVWLGRNWGMPMSRKEDPGLVTGGPYARVRHPIYGGILLAMLGSAIGESVAWTLPLILFGAYFVYAAKREEKLMTEQFPDRYPGYMKRTRMLLPFLL